MIDAQSIDKALQVRELKLPSSPRITKIDWDSFEDSDGDESLEIHVVLEDQTTNEEIEQAPIHAIKRAIIGSLGKHGVTLFPYFIFERESEHDAPIHEE